MCGYLSMDSVCVGVGDIRYRPHLASFPRYVCMCVCVRVCISVYVFGGGLLSSPIMLLCTVYCVCGVYSHSAMCRNDFLKSSASSWIDFALAAVLNGFSLKCGVRVPGWQSAFSLCKSVHQMVSMPQFRV